jgi:hypothetical protein
MAEDTEKKTEETEKKVVVTHEDALEAGYFGWVPDETPNEAYTVAGVTAAAKKAAAPAPKAAPVKKT